jgi:hypothetical protein
MSIDNDYSFYKTRFSSKNIGYNYPISDRTEQGNNSVLKGTI